MKKIVAFFRKETVLCVAAILAIISSLFVLPDRKYLKYIDFRTLALLLSLMIVVAGMRSIGVFEYVSGKLLKLAKNVRSMVLILVILCFVGSMIITNDVALITFVPFGILLLKKSNQQKYIIPVIVLETIAANLGSMFTPIGNPQNLFIYSISGMSILRFIQVMILPTSVSLAMIVICVMLFPKQRIDCEIANGKIVSFSKLCIFLLMLMVCMLCVFRVIEYPIMLIIVIAGVFFVNKTLLAKADYYLLLTFICFFIFVGNLQRIDTIHSIIGKLVSGHELLSGIAISQCISNVPAAVLISGFTSNYEHLLIGVNIGGLGTLIASMASLISFKLYSNEIDIDVNKGKYLMVFTGVNIVFLIVFLVLYTVVI